MEGRLGIPAESRSSWLPPIDGLGCGDEVQLIDEEWKVVCAFISLNLLYSSRITVFLVTSASLCAYLHATAQVYEIEFNAAI
jgi:hypothetical protein